MKKKQIFVIIIMVLLICIFLFLGFFFMNESKEKVKLKKATIIVNLKDDLNAEFLSEVRVSSFIENINGTIIDDYIIDTTKLGEKKIDFEYLNDENIRIKKSFNINVKDSVPPVVWLGKSYSVNVNSDINLTDKILCGDNYDSHPKCEIIGEYDINTLGTYPLLFKATDNSGNITEINFDLNVIEGRSGGYTETTTYFSDVISKYKNDNTEIGLDLSEWQDYPDYDKLKAAGVEFVFLRVGGSKYYTGEYFLDKSFKYNVEKANEAGIPVGVYFYSYAKTREQAIKDAEWIYNQIKDYKIDLGVAFDWENWSFYNEFGLSFYELTNMATGYLDYFKDRGYEGLLYSSKLYLEEIWLKTPYPTWLAHYTRDIEQTSYSGEYSYWQLCSDGIVDGVDGYVDINVRYKK